MQYETRENVLMSALAVATIAAICFVGQSLCKYYEAKYAASHDVIATITVKSGKEDRVFRVSEWVERKPSYCAFKTTDGQFVELVESEVSVK